MVQAKSFVTSFKARPLVLRLANDWHARCLSTESKNIADQSMSAIIQVIKDLCATRRFEGDRLSTSLDIDPATMRCAFASVLDGGATDMEIGALMSASLLLDARRTAGWFAEIVLGLNDAVRDRMTPLFVTGTSESIVVLPNYGEGAEMSVVPLVALLLQRMGVRVLVHGAIETHGGLLNCGVFREFGILPAVTRAQAELQLVDSGLVLLPVTLFSPGLASMLALQNQLGIRTPAHTLANMLMPLVESGSRSLHVLQVAPWLEPFLAEENVILESPALLVAADGSCLGTIDCRPRFSFRDGEDGCGWQTLLDADCVHSQPEMATKMGPDSLRGFHDPHALARWTNQCLKGKVSLPSVAANLLACCLYGCGYAASMHLARAIVAVDPGSRNAA